MSSSASAASVPLSVVERLAQQLSTSVTSQAIYGTPVECDGVTIVPVARARYGFGGGGGSGDQHEASNTKSGGGSGVGGGVALTPVGYIEIRQGQARFRRIRSSVVPLVAVSGLLAVSA